jgi:hypothetical protein
MQQPNAGSSPYSTGGGGVTFERKVAVHYLARLLTGDGAAELGDGRSVVEVDFQQAPEFAVDDLVIRAARPGEAAPSLMLALAVRRAPDLIESDEPTQKLVRAFTRQVRETPPADTEVALGIVVAGHQRHASQLAELAALAAAQAAPASFFTLVRTPGKFTGDVRGRLEQWEKLVKQALVKLGIATPSTELVQSHAWQILSRLTVLMPRLETPDETDWFALANALVPLSRTQDLGGALDLRDRLVALTQEYPPKAATVSVRLLRRAVHQHLDTAARRHRQGWQALGLLHDRAVQSVRAEVGEHGGRTAHLDRSDLERGLWELARTTNAVVVHGDSGVGKSALAVHGAQTARLSCGEMQAVVVNLRRLPDTVLALENHLGTPLANLLDELSAPLRVLVVDGADALEEGKRDQLGYLVTACRTSEVVVVAVGTSETKQFIRDAIAESQVMDIEEYLVPQLDDAQINLVIDTFPELRALAAEPRSRELLRRPVVFDLLAKGQPDHVPVSDADAMMQVWSQLVRRSREPGRGTANARDLALVRLARHSLMGGDLVETLTTIDAAALDGLRQDGLLRSSPEDFFAIGPDFSHDEVRRYAIARLLLTGPEISTILLEAGVPRWSLSAARLACQVRLAEAGSTRNPLRGRLSRLQAEFDQLVRSGHGARWSDVPGEALLTLGDPRPVLVDAWPTLRHDNDHGLQRTIRLINQRLLDRNGLVRVSLAEPVVELLVLEDAPWTQGKHVLTLLRRWLHALACAGTPAGHRSRITLRERLLAVCVAADERDRLRKDAAEKARAARSPEQIEEDREEEERRRTFARFLAADGRARRRVRDVPREIVDESVVELLALLGPDLGEDGEAILRRIAVDASGFLWPAVEKLHTDHALVAYGRGLLVDLAEAYYVQDDTGWTSEYDFGVRRHRSVGFGPLRAWYFGPFYALFKTDLVNAAAMVNRMLNHAARVRNRRGSFTVSASEESKSDHQTSSVGAELEITGERRWYFGDAQVWMWYRGAGIGPYPCMSALLALERACDEHLKNGVPLADLVSILLDGCENLATIGLVVGLIIRHLEEANGLIDAYLAEPVVWDLEIVRREGELISAAPSDGRTVPDRRTWALTDVAMRLVLSADAARRESLRVLGETLVSRGRTLAEGIRDSSEGPINDAELARVRAWASTLDFANYSFSEAEQGVYVQSTPPQEVIDVLERNAPAVQRSLDEARLTVKYYIDSRNGIKNLYTAEDLEADIDTARNLLDHLPETRSGYEWDVPAMVAAAALEAHVLNGVDLPSAAIEFATATIVMVAAGESYVPKYDSLESYFEQGAERSAARALPLLLLPAADVLRVSSAIADGASALTDDDIIALGNNLATALVNEIRVHLARGFDRVWSTPCATARVCHHEPALELVGETMRDAVFGAHDEQGYRRPGFLEDPIGQSLAQASDDAIFVARLDAALRALAPAAVADICVSRRAEELLGVVLNAHRRGQLAHEDNYDARGTSALHAARALLTLVGDGEPAPILDHLDALAGRASFLHNFLRALSAAAEENSARARTAQRIWPSVMTRVLTLHRAGRCAFHSDHDGDMARAALLPNRSDEHTWLYREVEQQPILWWSPRDWQDNVAAWLPVARGNTVCIDQLIGFLVPLQSRDRAVVGLGWIADLVLAAPQSVANRTYLLVGWLIEIHSAARENHLADLWQQIVDALVVAGEAKLAPYSE